MSLSVAITSLHFNGGSSIRVEWRNAPTATRVLLERDVENTRKGRISVVLVDNSNVALPRSFTDQTVFNDHINNSNCIYVLTNWDAQNNMGTSSVRINLDEL